MASNDDGIGTPLVAFNELVLKREKVAGQKKFRLAESPSVLIVNEEIVDSLVENRPEDGWGIDVCLVDVV